MTIKSSILIIFSILLLVLIVTIPKIWLRSNIYYISKDINKLYYHYMSLKEENIYIQQKLEDIKFKNQITNSIILKQIDD